MYSGNYGGRANIFRRKWKSRGTRYLKTRCMIAGFIFAVVGWFLLAVLLFGSFYEEELLRIEVFVKSLVFQWSLRAVIVVVIIVLFRKNEWLDRLMGNVKLKIALYVFCGIGGVGWVWGIIDLIT